MNTQHRLCAYSDSRADILSVNIYIRISVYVRIQLVVRLVSEVPLPTGMVIKCVCVQQKVKCQGGHPWTCGQSNTSSMRYTAATVTRAITSSESEVAATQCTACLMSLTVQRSTDDPPKILFS